MAFGNAAAPTCASGCFNFCCCLHYTVLAMLSWRFPLPCIAITTDEQKDSISGPGQECCSQTGKKELTCYFNKMFISLRSPCHPSEQHQPSHCSRGIPEHHHAHLPEQRSVLSSRYPITVLMAILNRTASWLLMNLPIP